jgi:hypothetical protein
MVDFQYLDADPNSPDETVYQEEIGPQITDRAREETTAGKKADFVVPPDVHFLKLYGCCGGDGGSPGESSRASQVPGAGGKGGTGYLPSYWADKDGRRDIPVNPGQVFTVEIGAGGASGQVGGQTIFAEKPEAGVPGKKYVFSSETSKQVAGGGAAARGRDAPGVGKSVNGPNGNFPGGSVWQRLGHQDNHWGGGGGGGGAGRGPGGNGGAGGCDGGTEIAMGGTGNPDFQRAHSGQPGSDARGNCAGGGGGGGAGDTDKDGGVGAGGPGGRGGDGYLVILW